MEDGGWRVWALWKWHGLDRGSVRLIAVCELRCEGGNVWLGLGREVVDDILYDML